MVTIIITTPITAMVSVGDKKKAKITEYKSHRDMEQIAKLMIKPNNQIFNFQ